MARSRVCLVILLFLFYRSVAFSNEILLDRLAAEVNGQPIFYSEVMDKVKRGPLITVSPYPSKESDPQFDIALNDMINIQLLKLKSKELDIEVTDEEGDEGDEERDGQTRRDRADRGLFWLSA